jgi:hypothetical protein
VILVDQIQYLSWSNCFSILPEIFISTSLISGLKMDLNENVKSPFLIAVMIFYPSNGKSSI